uniref:non-specific serine/threonine protein kinase n=1 Tax=Ditylenchus dipsaci TaxID=166011 RepID=A0A915DS14_9BILA
MGLLRLDTIEVLEEKHSLIFNMGKFNVTAMRYLNSEHFRVLLSVEMGMKNHESRATARALNDLTKLNVVVYERGKRYDGFRLTNLGYDFLALHWRRQRVRCLCWGDPELKDIALKFHRLGRTSFRKIKEKRDYHKKRHFCSWLYLARIAAIKEFSFLKALHSRNFPVPKPIDVCRHTVVMGLIDGVTLSQVHSISDVEALFDKLMSIIVRMAKYGLIHGDFNEFNIILLPDEQPIMIDFPQMVSIDHPNAEFYFNRDVECVRDFFRRKFNFDCKVLPQFCDIKRKYNLDVELEASGFTKRMALDLNKAYDEGNFEAHHEENDESSEAEDESIEEGEMDEEELKQTSKEGQTQKHKLGRTKMFNDWLESARAELEKVTVEEEECPDLEEMDEQTLLKYKEIARDAEQKMQQMEEAQESLKESDDGEGEVVHDGEDGDKKGRLRDHKRGKVTDQRSVYSCGSTISPEEIKQRLMKDRHKAKKEKMRVKGKQCAVQRGRKENIDLMKEYAGLGRIMAAGKGVTIPDGLEYQTDQFLVPKCYEEDLSAVIIPEGLIHDRIKRLAHEIHNTAGDQPLVMLCVLKGSYRFFTILVDEISVARQSFGCKSGMMVEFIKVRSYEDTKSTGSIEITGLSNLKELSGKSVLVVDDIVDSGVAKVWTSVLLSKRVTRKVDVQEDFVAFNIPDKFIVGYGLDYNQIFRDLNHICIMNETGIEKYRKK